MFFGLIFFEISFLCLNLFFGTFSENLFTVSSTLLLQRGLKLGGGVILEFCSGGGVLGGVCFSRSSQPKAANFFQKWSKVPKKMDLKLMKVAKSSFNENSSRGTVHEEIFGFGPFCRFSALSATVGHFHDSFVHLSCFRLLSLLLSILGEKLSGNFAHL